ncbi:hypothetical protein D3C81_2174190 [compost metagenome]
MVQRGCDGIYDGPVMHLYHEFRLHSPEQLRINGFLVHLLQRLAPAFLISRLFYLIMDIRRKRILLDELKALRVLQ